MREISNIAYAISGGEGTLVDYGTSPGVDADADGVSVMYSWPNYGPVFPFKRAGFSENGRYETLSIITSRDPEYAETGA